MTSGRIRAALAAAFDKRPRFDRIVLSLLYLERLTPAETAIAVGCSVRRVLDSRSRALAELRGAVQRRPASPDLARSLSTGGRVSLRGRA